MKISASFLVFFVLVAGCFAQAPPQSSDEPLTQILPGILIPASLSKSLDAKKAKPGDKIELKVTMDMLTHGKVVIPRNSKIEGHVTSAKPHTKESPDSALVLVFDRILIKDGQELPMKAAVQAIGPPLIANFDAPGTPAGIGGPPPGQDSKNVGSSQSPDTAINTVGQYSPMPASDPSTASDPNHALTAQSRGAVGMKELVVSGQDGTSSITSSNKNVHLDGGTQFMLRTQ